MNYFIDITIKKDIEKYLNELDETTMLIYSPTSIKKINFNNKKVKSINWHDISKRIEKIDIVTENNNNIEKIVTFGGGSTIDIGKYVSHKLNVEYVCVPSMLSTNSYATNKVALIKDGNKITLDAKLPDYIYLDEKILKMSKTENLYGLADVLSIYTALYDWKLAAKNINEKIDEEIYEMSSRLLKEVLEFILNHTLEEISNSIDKLYEYIGRAGYITNIYGTGRPESGSEHIFAKEMEKMLDIPHGISVSLGIIIMSIAQERENEQIIKAINKIQVLDKQRIYGINKNIIKECLLNIRPREDRYTIVNTINNNRNIILKQFYEKSILDI